LEEGLAPSERHSAKPEAGSTMNEIVNTPIPDAKPRISLWRWAFRIVRWSTYAAAAITLILVLHKKPAPHIETSALAATRAEEKIERVQQRVGSGEQATLRMDESELNSYLATHLELRGSGNTGEAGEEPDGEAVRSSVRDVKVELVGDHVKAYVVFDLHGKDVSLELEGKLGVSGGYLRFEPTSGAIGAFPLPHSALNNAMRHVMDSPENREKLRLPVGVSDLRIENGEIVLSYE
jgi:hypothetical protein